MATVELQIPALSAYVGIVRLALSSLARTAGLDEERVDDLKIAVSEACANAVLACERAGGGGPIAVTWDQNDGRLVIEIGGPGEGLDPRSVDLSDTQSVRFAMSAELLRSLVDELEFTKRRGGGVSTHISFVVG